MKRKILLGTLVAAAAVGALFVGVRASDHDDGENDFKARALNLTDLYVFREYDQDPAAAAGNLIFIMNTNPRSLARQQYPFSTQALYDFHVTRRASVDDPVTGSDDVVLRFQFGAPDAQNRQRITVTALKDGQTFSTSVRSDNGQPVTTIPLQQPEPATVAASNLHPFVLDGSTLTVFAGLREDPFFFDVEQFFRVRAGALGTGPGVVFRDLNTAVDFTKGYNVNAIVVRVPIAFLAGTTGASVYDVWETISIPN